MVKTKCVLNWGKESGDDKLEFLPLNKRKNETRRKNGVSTLNKLLRWQ